MAVKHIHGGNLREAAIKYGVAKDRIIDFSANINPLGPSKLAVKAIKENLDQIIHYPDPHCMELRDALGRFLEVPSANLLMGNGAAEIIYLLVRHLKPRRVLIPAPTFSEYELAVITNDGAIEDLMLPSKDCFRIPVNEVIEALDRVDMVVICNPNNPTGQLMTKEELEGILEAAEEKGIFLLVDEAFMDFVPEPEKYSILKQAVYRPNLMVLYSMTKFFGIPGLRLGAAVAGRELIGTLASVKDPWNVNFFAQAAGLASLQDLDYMDQTRKLAWAEKEFLFEALCSLPGFKPIKPSANYIFADIRETGYSSPVLQDLLGKQGILIRDCSSYKNLDSYYIRVAVKTRAENQRLIAALQETITRRGFLDD